MSPTARRACMKYARGGGTYRRKKGGERERVRAGGRGHEGERRIDVVPRRAERRRFAGRGPQPPRLPSILPPPGSPESGTSCSREAARPPPAGFFCAQPRARAADLSSARGFSGRGGATLALALLSRAPPHGWDAPRRCNACRGFLGARGGRPSEASRPFIVLRARESLPPLGSAAYSRVSRNVRRSPGR